jgi:hypothetical protein
MTTWHGKTSRNLGRTGVAAVAIVLLACGSAAAKELKLTRTAKSGVETRLAYSAHWDTKTCNSLPNKVTISKQPAHGTASIKPAEETLPQSTPGSGATSPCAGKKVQASAIMYRSNPGFKGIDTLAYHTEAGIDATITVTVE